MLVLLMPRLACSGALGLVALMLMSVVASAQSPGAHVYVSGPITVHHPWARATAPGGSTSLVFMDIENSGGDDRLLGARAEIAQSAEIVAITIVSGPNSTIPIGPVELPANASFELHPHGAALELRGLARPLVQGDVFALALRFERAGDLVVDVEVEGVAATRHGH